MKVYVLGQISINGVDMHVYQFPNVSEIKDNVYFGHKEVLPFLLVKAGVGVEAIETIFDDLSTDDIVDWMSSKDNTTRHIFVKAAAFGKLSKLTLFDDENWKEQIHPVTLFL